MSFFLLFIAISFFNTSHLQSELPSSKYLKEAQSNALRKPDYSFEMAKKSEEQ
jgi:hypothetical protein